MASAPVYRAFHGFLQSQFQRMPVFHPREYFLKKIIGDFRFSIAQNEWLACHGIRHFPFLHDCIIKIDLSRFIYILAEKTDTAGFSLNLGLEIIGFMLHIIVNIYIL